MKTIIAADIYGVTDELRSMLMPITRGAVFLSPWDTEECPFADEQAAVSAFVSQHGIESYAEKIAAAANREPAFIIGFSVGASAAWVYSASACCHLESTAVLFYGSRIRDYASLIPRIKVNAIFAETEVSCSSAQLARVIAGDTVRTCIVPGTRHGFMNPRSTYFSPMDCSAYLQELVVEWAQWQEAMGSTVSCAADLLSGTGQPLLRSHR